MFPLPITEFDCICAWNFKKKPSNLPGHTCRNSLAVKLVKFIINEYINAVKLLIYYGILL